MIKILIFLNIISLSAMSNIISVDFQVYGKVQGVFFRKHTQEEAKKLNLRGWCMNTEEGTVKGVIEGPEERIKIMKNWLKTVGSPKSVIRKTEFYNEKKLPNFTYNSFEIKR